MSLHMLGAGLGLTSRDEIHSVRSEMASACTVGEETARHSATGTRARDGTDDCELRAVGVRFASHEAAEAALPRLKGSLEGEGGAAYFDWSGRPYKKRGWPIFESGVSLEVMARGVFFPKSVWPILDRLPSKLVEIDSDVLKKAGIDGDALTEGAGPRLMRLHEEVRQATFTGRGDQELVIGMIAKFAVSMKNAMVAGGEALPDEYIGERNASGQRHGRTQRRL
jgi:hypothetical protein